jgi:hypothetical protein
MKIAIDLDGTVIDTVGAVLQQFHPDFPMESVITYKLDECIPNLTKERCIWEFEHIDWRIVEFIGKKTRKCLSDLDSMNYNEFQFYFLTSKTPQMMNWTTILFYMESLTIPIITSLKKQDYVGQFDILIEDNPEMLNYGIPIEKLRFIKQPWNVCLEEKGIKRYNEISEIIEVLNL